MTRYRAKKKGIDFNLDHGDLNIPTNCPLLGHEIIEGDYDWGPSLDRLDPSKGYTKDNVKIISNKANRLKGNATYEEMHTLFNNLNKYLKI